MSNSVNLSDSKLYKLVNENSDVNSDVNSDAQTETQEKNATMVIIENNKCHNPLMKFLTGAFILALIAFLLYITIYRFVLGYNFFKNKEYMKTAATISPELVALSSILL